MTIEALLDNNGFWGFMGTIVGAVFTMSTLALRDAIRFFYRRKRDNPRKKLLKKMLSSGLRWRNISTLSNVTGLSEAETKRLLIEIKARGSENDPTKWGLISRNPLPTHDDPSG